MTILHVDGREERSRFPDAIDPACPFRDIRAISHEIAPGTWATCTMQGDAYEMEDQRNWSDASYKTYVRPLAKPWPYTLPKGEPVVQSVTLAISGNPPAADVRGPRSRARLHRPRDRAGCRRSASAFLPGRPSTRSRPVTCSPASPRVGSPARSTSAAAHGLADLRRYRALADLTGAEIVLEIITRGSLDPAGRACRARRIGRRGGPLARGGVGVPGAGHGVGAAERALAGDAELRGDLRRGARRVPGREARRRHGRLFHRAQPQAPAGRRRSTIVTHTTCPTVHAADDRSVMETNEALRHQIRSTRAFMGDGLAYRIGPSQIGCRENPYGKAPAPNPGNGRVCLATVDPRQRGLFNAAWTLAYAAACARGEIEALAFGAPTGPFGHIYRRAGFAQPYFDALDGPSVYPAFHVVAGLAALDGATVLSTEVTPGGAAAALAVRDGARTVLWLANLTADALDVELPTDLAGARIVSLDADAFEELTRAADYLDTGAHALPAGPVRLDAFSVARLEAPLTIQS